MVEVYATAEHLRMKAQEFYRNWASPSRKRWNRDLGIGHYNQRTLAEDIGVHPSAVSNALCEYDPASSRISTLIKIIEHTERGARVFGPIWKHRVGEDIEGIDADMLRMIARDMYKDTTHAEVARIVGFNRSTVSRAFSDNYPAGKYAAPLASMINHIEGEGAVSGPFWLYMNPNEEVFF